MCAPHTIAVEGNFDDALRLVRELSDSAKWKWSTH